MTAISNLVANLDCSHPPVIDLFSPEYRKMLLNNVDNYKLNTAKILVESYIKSELGDNIVGLKLYSYKTLSGISVEILIQPENTSVIIQYVLNINSDSVKLVRIR